MKKLFFSILTLFVSQLAVAEIANPTLVDCEVTSVTPKEARFFGHGKGIVTGDKTTLDLGAKEIPKIIFESGSYIGSSVRPHPLIQEPPLYVGFANFRANFTSQANSNDYKASLVATENSKNELKLSLDVVELKQMGRINHNAIELNCKRK